MLIGYARISTDDQSLDMQIRELERYGVGRDHIFTDRTSGVSLNRGGLGQCLRAIDHGDLLVVWKLDRLARSVSQLVEAVKYLEKREAGLKSITEPIDTTCPGGTLIFHMMAAVAQFERDLIRERTKAGMKAARERGVKVGRKRIATKDKIEWAKSLIRSGECISIAEVAKRVGLAESTLYRDIRGGAKGLLDESSKT